jgi:hypothetical protein
MGQDKAEAEFAISVTVARWGGIPSFCQIYSFAWRDRANMRKRISLSKP